MASSSVLPLIAQRLAGKVALITGAASGIGATTAKLFSQHGAKVIIADIQEDLGRSLVEKLGPDSATFVHCNVTDESSVKTAVDVAMAQHGKLDILFSNAGTMGKPITSILQTDHDTIKRVFDVNIFGAFYCAKHAARVMIPAKAGTVLFNASIATGTSFGNVPHPYTTSKNAVMGLSKNLGVELGQYGIRVNCISPYAMSTPLALNAFGLAGRGQADDVFTDAGNLKGAVAEEDDAANAALYLVSDEAKYVSGVNLMVDGGYSTTNKAFTEAFRRMSA
ncbi:hypothetical protein LguiB_001077 [Lonicera macranthoides]